MNGVRVLLVLVLVVVDLVQDHRVWESLSSCAMTMCDDNGNDVSDNLN